MENNSPITTPIEETQKCMVCGKILPVSKFERYTKRGYHTARKACEDKEYSQDEKFKDFTSRELILELRARGYRGKLQKVTVDEIVI